VQVGLVSASVRAHRLVYARVLCFSQGALSRVVIVPAVGTWSSGCRSLTNL
jgi:hypothetical protein